MKTFLLNLYKWLLGKVILDEEFNKKRDNFLKEHE